VAQPPELTSARGALEHDGSRSVHVGAYAWHRLLRPVVHAVDLGTPRPIEQFLFGPTAVGEMLLPPLASMRKSRRPANPSMWNRLNGPGPALRPTAAPRPAGPPFSPPDAANAASSDRIPSGLAVQRATIASSRRHRTHRRAACRHVESLAAENRQRKHGLRQAFALTPSGRRRHQRLQAAAALRLPAPRPLPRRTRQGRSCCSRWSRSSRRNAGRGRCGTRRYGR